MAVHTYAYPGSQELAVVALLVFASPSMVHWYPYSRLEMVSTGTRLLPL